MQIEVESARPLSFADGSPVRAASGVSPLGDGFLVVQDDATHACWVNGEDVAAVRLLPPVEGHDDFDEESGTKHLKPDLEAACRVSVGGGDGVLVLGSGSSDRRMRWVLVQLEDGRVVTTVAELAPVYSSVADALGVAADELNLEGVSLVGDRLRWYHRGLPSAGRPSGSVDLDLQAALAVVTGAADPLSVHVSDPRHYDLGEVAGVGLAVTDSVALPDGTILLSAAAEDSPNARDDGPVVGSALVRLEGDHVADVTPLPAVGGSVMKVEGLTLLDLDEDVASLLAVVDQDDPGEPSLAVRLRVAPGSTGASPGTSGPCLP